MKNKIFTLILPLIFTPFLIGATPSSTDVSDAPQLYWMKVKASNKNQRSLVAKTGVSIETIHSKYVTALGSKQELLKLKNKGVLLKSARFDMHAHGEKGVIDYPKKDANFHNYEEMVNLINELKEEYSDTLKVEVIGKSIEGRDIYNLQISSKLDNANLLPGIIFMGGHHAREHLSVEMPLMLAEYLLKEYRAGNKKIQNLVDSREINIIPIVNPDGAEFDIHTGRYQTWRKNRREIKRSFRKTYGVDLNRNYSFKWGTGGSSKNPRSQTYMGEKPFSEPETQAVKKFVESHPNTSILLSFHTFSELILYPWGHKYESIDNQRDFLVHKTMAETMAKWNKYKPQQSSDLYIASGDTTDWSYGQHGIISFTFELDPKSRWQGGFYPGAKKIPVVFKKNLLPSLYLIEKAQNPYQVLRPKHLQYGLKSSLVR